MNVSGQPIARWGAILFLLFLGTGLFWVRQIDGNRPDRPALELVFEARASNATTGRLIVDGHHQIQYQLPGGTVWREVRLPLAEGHEPLYSIRLDPLGSPGNFEFRQMRIVRGEQVLVRIESAHLEALNVQSPITDSGEGSFRVRLTSAADYPVILLRHIYPLDTPVFNSAVFGTRSLILSWIVAGGVALLLLVGLGRSYGRGGWQGILLGGGTFLTIIGLRLLTLEYFGNRVPHWDYWSLPWATYLPFMEGNLTWQCMIAPVNEHRIFFTRLLSLGLFWISGQWDNLYEASINSSMHALTGTGLALLLWNACGRTRGNLIFPTIILIMGLPFSWENTVWANQSQFYFFLGFSILTLWLLGMHRPGTTRWWLGGSAALATQFTIGSGFVIPLIVIALVAYQTLRVPAGWRDGIKTVVFAALLFGIALLFRVDTEAGGMKTQNLSQFIHTFGRTMSWPYVLSNWLWLFLWLPIFAYVLHCLIRRPAWSKAEAWIVTLGGWSLVNALGVGIYRGAFSQGPLSRYMDIAALPVIANILALALLWAISKGAGQRVRKGVFAFSCAWGLVVGIGILHITNHELNHAATSRLQQQERALHNIRHFMQTGDLQTLLAKREFELPHPNAFGLAAWLSAPAMRAILPPSIRDPLPLEPATMNGFTSPGVYLAYDFDMHEPTWGSYGREGDRTTGQFTSKPVPASRFRYLQFPVLSRTADGQDRVVLRMVDSRGSSHRVALPGDSPDWRVAHVRVPKEPLTVEAFDYDERFWIAFRSPREVSTAVYFAWRYIQSGPMVLGLGLALLLSGYLTGSRLFAND
jgi:hypothetical protein